MRPVCNAFVGNGADKQGSHLPELRLAFSGQKQKRQQALVRYGNLRQPGQSGKTLSQQNGGIDPMKPVRMMLLVLALATMTGCRQSEDGNYVRLAGNLFIFNYREAVATYVISLQRLRPLPQDTQWKATFDNPQGGEPLIVMRKVSPGSENIGVESDPVYCIVEGKPYKYTIELISNNKSIQSISGTITSTLSQDILPERPLVIGPGYHRNPASDMQNDTAKRALGIDRCTGRKM